MSLGIKHETLSIGFKRDTLRLLRQIIAQMLERREETWNLVRAKMDSAPKGNPPDDQDCAGDDTFWCFQQGMRISDHLEKSTRADEALFKFTDLLGMVFETQQASLRPGISEIFLGATRAVARSMERLEKKAGGYHLEFEDDAQWCIGDEPSTERMTAERPGDTRRTEAAAV